ncbi:protein of unknown function [Thermococcus nautili]|nr:protein of unknown function [Thermococcus nautili]
MVPLVIRKVPMYKAVTHLIYYFKRIRI